MNKTILSVLAVSSVLVGCDDGYSTQLADVEAKEANNIAFTQLNSEKEKLGSMLSELKKRDPSVTDVFYSLDQGGRKTITVERRGPTGEIETWEMPSEMFAESQQKMQMAQAQAQQSGSSFNSNAFLMGYLLSNALSPSSAGFTPSYGTRNSFADSNRYNAYKRSNQSLYNSSVNKNAQNVARVNQASRSSAAFSNSSNSSSSARSTPSSSRSSFSSGGRGASASSGG